MDKALVTGIYFVAEFMAKVPVIKLNTCNSADWAGVRSTSADIPELGFGA